MPPVPFFPSNGCNRCLGSRWYVWGWCEKREDFRLFKLNRMTQVRALPERFSGRKVPLPDLSTEHIFPGGIREKALFEPEMKWRLVEEFGADCFEVQTDGKLLFNGDYTDKAQQICSSSRFSFVTLTNVIILFHLLSDKLSP